MGYLMGFGSTHKALKAESIFKEAGLPFKLLPAPKSFEADCGLVISVEDDDFEKAKEILSGAGLPFKNIYRKEGDVYVKV